MASKIKPFSFPKAKSPNLNPKPTPAMTEQEILKQFSTKPIVKPPTKAATGKLTKKLKSYLP